MRQEGSPVQKKEYPNIPNENYRNLNVQSVPSAALIDHVIPTSSFVPIQRGPCWTIPSESMNSTSML